MILILKKHFIAYIFIMFIAVCCNGCTSADDMAFNQATQEDTIIELNNYLERYPEGKHKEEAIVKKQHLQEIENEKKEKAHQAEEKDNQDWENAVNKNTVEAYLCYLKDKSHTIHILDASKCIDRYITSEALNVAGNPMNLLKGEAFPLELFLAEELMEVFPDTLSIVGSIGGETITSNTGQVIKSEITHRPSYKMLFMDSSTESSIKRGLQVRFLSAFNNDRDILNMSPFSLHLDVKTYYSNEELQKTEVIGITGVGIAIVTNESNKPQVYVFSKNGRTCIVPLDKNSPIPIISPLLNASQEGNAEVVRQLLERGTEVNAVRTDGATPLFLASQNGHTEIVGLLLGAKADVNIANRNDATPLLMASGNGHTEVVKLLLKATADVNASDKKGFNPLFKASWMGYSEVVKLLLESKANVNYASDKTGGVTPLMMALAKGDAEVVKLLLEAKADVNVKVNIGSKDYTPLSFAQQVGHNEIVKLLKEYGAKE